MASPWRICHASNRQCDKQGADLRETPVLVCCCLGCDPNQTVALDIVRRPKTMPIHELERYMRCKDCSEMRGYPYKHSSYLVALRRTKISASDPPST